MSDWKLFKDVHPEPGQLCEMKICYTVKAYFTPGCKISEWIKPHNQEKSESAVEWRGVKHKKDVK